MSSNKRPADEVAAELEGVRQPPSHKRACTEEDSRGEDGLGHFGNGTDAKNHGSSGTACVSTEENSDKRDGGKRTDDKDDADYDDDDDAKDSTATSAETDNKRAKGAQANPENQERGLSDLYLHTINRAVLDFDFEKLCSVTLTNLNVYACLVCGKYFQGRGPHSQAYFHALDQDHLPFINMETKKVYILPDGYEVLSQSLNDIKYVVDPQFTREEVALLDKEQKVEWDLAGRKYVPGLVGINNIKANDYFNVIIHCLAHVPPLRNFYMLADMSKRPQLSQRFNILVRKIWNPRAFKAHVSPHELLQEIALRSSKRFTLTEQADPVDFLSWFLNNLHLSLGGHRTKPGTSIVQKVFQGSMKIESQLITARADAGDRLRFEDAEVQTQLTNFLILTLDLPPTPLFQDELERNIIPQIPLTTVLCKYDGVRAQERLNQRRRYRLLHPLPPYLIFHIKRFTKNKFVHERNPTIVTFNTRSLDMSPYVEPNPNLHPFDEPILYDLIANVTHEAVKIRDDSVEGEAENKIWLVQLLDKTREEWVEVHDLFVGKVRAETIFTKESHVQFWERRKINSPQD